MFAENGMFKYVSDKEPRATRPHKPDKYVFFVFKVCSLHSVLQSRCRFSSSDHLFVVFVELINFTGGLFPVCTLDPIYQLDLVEKKMTERQELNKLLFHPTSNNLTVAQGWFFHVEDGGSIFFKTLRRL